MSPHPHEADVLHVLIPTLALLAITTIPPLLATTGEPTNDKED